VASVGTAAGLAAGSIPGVGVAVNNAFCVTFSYDADRLLTGAGALTITRLAQTGRVTGTTLFGTTEAHEYNAFGEPSRQTARNGATPVFDVQISEAAP
jgi:hypothetical protein